MNIVNKEKQAGPKFLTGKAHKVMVELENSFIPNYHMTRIGKLIKQNKTKLKNANENLLQMIERIEKLKMIPVRARS